MKKNLPLLMVLTLCVGCASSSIYPSTEQLPLNSHVKLYIDPPEKFQKIAYITVEEYGREKALARIKLDAARLGADAIIIEHLELRTIGWGIAGTAIKVAP